MYNVVLVDDESSALEGLVSFVNWEKYGFKIAARCKSGNEALKVSDARFVLLPSAPRGSPQTL